MGAAAAAAAIRLSSSQKRRNRRKDKLRGNAQAKEVKHAKCKRGHTMAMRTDNPKGYLNDACCDVCALPNLVKKCDFYFHCAFCKWDVCPNCIIKYEEDRNEPKKKKKKKGGEEVMAEAMAAVKEVGAKGANK